jgi:hypothetical protein
VVDYFTGTDISISFFFPGSYCHCCMVH